jgi:archaellum component FlaC
MAEPENIVLVHLRRMDEKLDRMADDIRDLKVRMTMVEVGLATLNNRVDRIESRLERIERRLDLVDAR